MKVVYGISPWTNMTRPAARHLDDGKGLPACGGAGRKVISWETEEAEKITCWLCERILKKINKGVSNDKSSN
jgi:hypothetical protein